MTKLKQSILAIVLGITTLAVTTNSAHATSLGAPEEVGQNTIPTSAIAIFEKIQQTADPEEAFLQLSQSDQKLFNSSFLGAHATTEFMLTPVEAPHSTSVIPRHFHSESVAMDAIATSKGCWVGTSKFTMYAALGNALWDTWTEGQWCGNGHSVSAVSFNRSWSTIAAVGWRDTGLIGSGQAASQGHAKMWSQRSLVLGINGWDVQTQQPCNRLNGYADGSTSLTPTCSIL